jgi:GAF domain-containing protein
MTYADSQPSTTPDDPVRDPERLAEIARLDLFSDEVSAIISDMAERASARFNLPVSLVSVVLDEAQYFAAQHGIDESWMADANGTPIEWSFCKYTVEDNDAFVVEDAELNERTKDNPLVENDDVRCYAGIPLITARDYVVGSLCVIGLEPRSFGEDELDDLRAMADEVMRRIEDRAAEKASNGTA